MKVVGEYLSYDPYGLVYRRDDPGFAAVVEKAFARMAVERRLTELYNKWFLHRLPTGETLNLPMSPQLEEIFRVLGTPDWFDCKVFSFNRDLQTTKPGPCPVASLSTVGSTRMSAFGRWCRLLTRKGHRGEVETTWTAETVRRRKPSSLEA